MFTRYKFRVFIAMSAQAFAQLVRRALPFRLDGGGKRRAWLLQRTDVASPS